MPNIIASILSADFVNLESEIQKVSNADYLHVDVMDYHYVPNLTFGGEVVKKIIDVSPIPVDVHLMIDQPDLWAADYVHFGANVVSFHYGATKNPIALSKKIQEHGALSCLALKPDEPLDLILDTVRYFDWILIMTVEPGFGSQPFLKDTLKKITNLKKYIQENDLTTQIEVDGGVTEHNIAQIAASGANNIVSGSNIFLNADPTKQIEILRKLANNN